MVMSQRYILARKNIRIIISSQLIVNCIYIMCSYYLLFSQAQSIIIDIYT